MEVVQCTNWGCSAKGRNFQTSCANIVSKLTKKQTKGCVTGVFAAVMCGSIMLRVSAGRSIIPLGVTSTGYILSRSGAFIFSFPLSLCCRTREE
jgi:hypothetical protein